MSFFTTNIVVSNPIPQEVKIYYSKDAAIVRIIFLLVIFSMSLYMAWGGQWLVALVPGLIALIFITISLKPLLNNKPQVVINTEGIQISGSQFYRWTEIKNERVSGEYYGRGARPTLEYDHPHGSENLSVDNLNITPQDLNVLLHFYRKPWGFGKEFKPILYHAN